MTARGDARAFDGRRVVVISRRGRFAVAEPVFERGPQLSLAKGSRGAEEGRMALAEIRPTGARVVRELGRPSARRARGASPRPRPRARVRDQVKQEAAEAARAASADLGRPPRSHRARDVHRRPRDRARLRRRSVGAARGRRRAAVDPHRGRRSPRPPRHGSGGRGLRVANSTYVPGAVEPMLPPELSNDACSLCQVPRLTVTAGSRSQGAATSGGELLSQPDRSDARLHYDQLDEIFAARERLPSPSAPRSSSPRSPPPLSPGTARLGGRGVRERARVLLRRRLGRRGARGLPDEELTA